MKPRRPRDAARYAVKTAGIHHVSIAHPGHGDLYHAAAFVLAELRLECPATAARRFRLLERDTGTAAVQRRGQPIRRRLALRAQRDAAGLRVDVRLACEVPHLAALAEVVFDHGAPARELCHRDD